MFLFIPFSLSLSFTQHTTREQSMYTLKTRPCLETLYVYISSRDTTCTLGNNRLSSSMCVLFRAARDWGLNNFDFFFSAHFINNSFRLFLFGQNFPNEARSSINSDNKWWIVGNWIVWFWKERNSGMITLWGLWIWKNFSIFFDENVRDSSSKPSRTLVRFLLKKKVRFSGENIAGL